MVKKQKHVHNKRRMLLALFAPSARSHAFRTNILPVLVANRFGFDAKQALIRAANVLYVERYLKHNIKEKKIRQMLIL